MFYDTSHLSLIKLGSRSKLFMTSCEQVSRKSEINNKSITTTKRDTYICGMPTNILQTTFEFWLPQKHINGLPHSQEALQFKWPALAWSQVYLYLLTSPAINRSIYNM